MLLGIDATNWVHSLWHAQRGKGVITALLQRIECLITAIRPRHVVCCFDRRSFRHDRYPAYKATRKEKDCTLVQDLADAPAAVMDLATIATEDGYEADDCLASLAALGQRLGEKVVLASPDKDLLQCLVDGQVTILRSFVRCSDGSFKEPVWQMADWLREKTKFSPQQWPDYQALCGDSGDNVPGCPGWGEVTSLAALQPAGSLAECFRNPWSLPITPRQQASLLKFRGQAELMLELVTLRTDVSAVVDAIR
jgi:DNA polymerase I